MTYVVVLCFIIFAPGAKFCRSRRLSDRIFSRQVAKTLSDGSNAIIPTHGEVSEGEIRNVLQRLCVFAGDIPILSVAALLRASFYVVNFSQLLSANWFLLAATSADDGRRKAV